MTTRRSRSWIALAAVLSVGLIGLGGYLAVTAEAEVVVDDRGDVLGLREDRGTVTTVADTMRELLAASAAAQATEVAARFDPGLDAAVHDGDQLAVEVAVPVTIHADGRERELTSCAETVAATGRLLEWLTDQGYRVTPLPGC